MFGEFSPKTRGTYQAGGMFLIQKQILTANQTSIIFPSIPQNFNHLKVIGYARSTTAATSSQSNARFNGDAGGNYDAQYLYATGTSVSAGGVNAATGIYCLDIVGGTGAANTFGTFEFTISYYANIFAYKSLIGQSSPNSQSLNAVHSSAGSWRNISAIYSITMVDNSGGSYVSGSEFCLYGVV